MYLSDRQVAKRYSVSRGTPWRWTKTSVGFPRPIELSPGCTRWKLEDLLAWEQRTETAKTQPFTSDAGKKDNKR